VEGRLLKAPAQQLPLILTLPAKVKIARVALSNHLDSM
jgi:hypothetical protein